VTPAISSPIPITVAALSPLALPDLPEGIGHRLAAYLFDERRFWTALPAPSVALDEPSFSLREHFDGLRRYWRGPTWINSAWLLWRGIVRLGYEEEAAMLARAITETVSREGLREFYDPHDGRGPAQFDPVDGGPLANVKPLDRVTSPASHSGSARSDGARGNDDGASAFASLGPSVTEHR